MVKVTRYVYSWTHGAYVHTSYIPSMPTYINTHTHAHTGTHARARAHTHTHTHVRATAGTDRQMGRNTHSKVR